jgi:uncharacterized membrane protein YkgB
MKISVDVLIGHQERRNKMGSIKGIFAAVIIVITLSGLIYASYWAVKTLSYQIFYKDMVRETTAEMVTPESLRKEKQDG